MSALKNYTKVGDGKCLDRRREGYDSHWIIGTPEECANECEKTAIENNAVSYHTGFDAYIDNQVENFRGIEIYPKRSDWNQIWISDSLYQFAVIVSKSYKTVMSIKGGECKDWTNVHMWTYMGNNKEKWILTRDGYIESVYCPGYVLGLHDEDCIDSKNAPTLVIRTKKNPGTHNSEAQQWTLSKGSFRNKKCKYIIDVCASCDVINGRRVFPSGTYHGGLNQQFDINFKPLFIISDDSSVPVILTAKKGDSLYVDYRMGYSFTGKEKEQLWLVSEKYVNNEKVYRLESFLYLGHFIVPCLLEKKICISSSDEGGFWRLTEKGLFENINKERILENEFVKFHARSTTFNIVNRKVNKVLSIDKSCETSEVFVTDITSNEQDKNVSAWRMNVDYTIESYHCRNLVLQLDENKCSNFTEVKLSKLRPANDVNKKFQTWTGNTLEGFIESRACPNFMIEVSRKEKCFCYYEDETLPVIGETSDSHKSGKGEVTFSNGLVNTECFSYKVSE